MNRKNTLIVSMFMLMASLLIACSGLQADSAVPEDAAIEITGLVNKSVGWTEDDLKSMASMELAFQDPEGNTTIYAGVPLSELLEECEVRSDADTLKFAKYDGSSREVAISDVEACENCLVTSLHEGKKPGLTILLPSVEENSKLIGIRKIVVK